MGGGSSKTREWSAYLPFTIHSHGASLNTTASLSGRWVLRAFYLFLLVPGASVVVSLKISPQLQSFVIKCYSGKCFVWAVFLLGFWLIELMSHCSSFPSLSSQASWKGALNSPLFSVYPSTYYNLASAAHESTKLIFPVGIFNITYDLALPSSSITHHLPWDHVLHPANDPRVVFGLL